MKEQPPRILEWIRTKIENFRKPFWENTKLKKPKWKKHTNFGCCWLSRGMREHAPNKSPQNVALNRQIHSKSDTKFLTKTYHLLVHSQTALTLLRVAYVVARGCGLCPPFESLFLAICLSWTEMEAKSKP